jgi:hypothetical protein
VTPTLTGVDLDWSGSPAPEDCVVEATTVQEIIEAIKVLPPAEDLAAFPITVPDTSGLPQGEEPDDEDLEAVSAAMWTAVACLNAGDFARFFNCLTPQGISAFIQGIFAAMGGTPGPLTEQQLADLETNLTTSLAATPEPSAEEDRVRIDKIHDARELADGRILILVDGTVGVSATVYAVFNEVDDEWLMEAFGQIGELPEMGL